MTDCEVHLKLDGKQRSKGVRVHLGCHQKRLQLGQQRGQHVRNVTRHVTRQYAIYPMCRVSFCGNGRQQVINQLEDVFASSWAVLTGHASPGRLAGAGLSSMLCFINKLQMSIQTCTCTYTLVC